MSGYAWPARRLATAEAGRSARDLVLAAAGASVLGLLVGVNPFYAVLVPAAFAGVWLVVRPVVAAVALGASIPAVQTIASGHLGLHIGVGDLLVFLLLFAALGGAVLARDSATFRALLPVRFPVLQYCVFVLVLLFAHAGAGPLGQTVQRYELIAFPLVIGAYLALRGAHLALLKGFVVAATVLAVVFPFASLGLQKNPAAQFMADAVLVVVGVPRLGRLRIVAPLLVFSLFATESRGALLACGAGVVVLLAFRWLHSPRQALAMGLAVAAVALASFQLLPARAQSFVTTYQAQGNSHAAWNIRYRQTYWHDALAITRAHPWLGVGVGSYAKADPAGPFFTSDPHNVFLLQAAEGGWGFAASFVVLILGVTVALVRLRRVELAAVACAVVLGNVAHGLLDVYWVRGTPVLGWLLVGVVCGLALRRREAEQP